MMMGMTASSAMTAPGCSRKPLSIAWRALSDQCCTASYACCTKAGAQDNCLCTTATSAVGNTALVTSVMMTTMTGTSRPLSTPVNTPKKSRAR